MLAGSLRSALRSSPTSLLRHRLTAPSLQTPRSQNLSPAGRPNPSRRRPSPTPAASLRPPPPRPSAAPTPHGGSSSSSGGSRMSFGATAGEAGTANKHSTDVQSTNRAGASALAFTPKVPVGHALISVRLLVLRDPAARACPTASPAPSTAATASWCRPPRTR